MRIYVATIVLVCVLIFLRWFIFTFLLVLCTLKSTVAFCSLFVVLDITFLLLAIAHLGHDNGVPNAQVTKVAGIFGLITSFIAWWNALAGLLENSNSFFTLPVSFLNLPKDKQN